MKPSLPEYFDSRMRVDAPPPPAAAAAYYEAHPEARPAALSAERQAAHRELIAELAAGRTRRAAGLLVLNLTPLLWTSLWIAQTWWDDRASDTLSPVARKSRTATWAILGEAHVGLSQPRRTMGKRVALFTSQPHGSGSSAMNR